MKTKPNIVLFFTDDQRFDTIHALGNEQIHTPHIDSLVARGTTFTRAHIPGGTCGAVCMPSRAMLHTGRTLFHLEGEGQSIPQSHALLGEVFRSADYDTFGTGKWHNGREAYARSFTHGDEIFFGGMGDHWNVPSYHFDPGGTYTVRCPYVPDPYNSKTVRYRECDHLVAGKHSTELFTDTSIRFFEERESGNPFFMYVSLMAPHDPRTMPQKFLNMYDPESITLPGNFLTEHPIDTGALKIRDEMLAAFPRDPKEIKQHIAEYYGMISHLDDALGRLVGQLEKSGELEKTIIVFAGDNGLAIGQHGLMGKQNLYEHSMRVPLIFAGPGIPRGEQRDNLTYLLDVFPTLCDLASLEKPASIEGKSLLPCINDAGTNHRDYLYLAYGDSIRGLSDGKHKLIEYACGETQLFDLIRDPLEKNSIYGQPSAHETLATLRKHLISTAGLWDDAQHPTGNRFWQARQDLKKMTITNSGSQRIK